MKRLILPFLVASFFMASCSKDEPIPTPPPGIDPSSIEVERFIYRGMNDIYLYKADVPVLADDYFATVSERHKYLAKFETPEALFDALQSHQDEFSFMTADYVALEKYFEGVSKTNGMKYGLSYYNQGNKVLGFVRYVLPNTAAAEQGIVRGDIFTEVNGVVLNDENYTELLNQPNYTINLGKYVDGAPVMSDQIINLSASEYTANPVRVSKVLEVDGMKIGYLMYNSFTGDFDDELNAAFGDFKAQAIDALVLDLRYNGGGSVESAVDLASMITGQYEGKVMMKEQWNADYQAYLEEHHPDLLVNRFNSLIRTEESINSLNLNRVYVLTTRSTASASELVINGLDPYIEVIQVGSATTGKFQASTTLYDSPNFGRENANPNHTYAIQPLIYASANVEGVSNFPDGLEPDLEIKESLGNLGELGETTDPLLKAAIDHFLGRTSAKQPEGVQQRFQDVDILGSSEMFEPNYQRMYDKNIPFLPKANE